ncbi:sulfotransferase 1E1-like [Pollicipes pollicipes]|uniref:sulfotransferase 1E1-like n=1 Tax=Pollicipes pollicipes TaxID=41117 RepID=UPI0018858B3C|nr:sulfotransferase 1E1-like [Pollicipes pollicipes]
MSSPLPFPWDPESLDPETLKRVTDAFPNHKESGMAYFGPSRCLAVPDSKPFFEEYYNTPLHSGDTWVVTLPKCGTTWTQELVWLLQNDCDFEGAKTMLMPDRWHFLEPAGITEKGMREMVSKGDDQPMKRLLCEPIVSRPQPWFVKTHLPLHMCPPKLLDTCKVVYVARNPKDVCISYFCFLGLYNETSKDLTLEQFVDLFIEGNVLQLPFFPHVLEAWRQRNHPNMLFLFFEDLKKDLRGSIMKVASFLGKNPTEENLDKLEDHLHFRNFKNNPWVNWEWLTKTVCNSDDPNKSFMRKGQTGDWKNHFTPEMDKKMEAWIKKELEGTELTFVMEIPEGGK